MYYLPAAIMSLSLALASPSQDAFGDERATVQSQGSGSSSSAVETFADGKEILKHADEALKRVEAVSYNAVFKGVGFMLDRTPVVRGTVVMAGKGADGPPKFRLKVDARPVRAEPVNDLIVGSDGQIHYLIDPKAKTAYVGNDSSVIGPLGKTALAVILQHFSHPNALFDERNMELATLTGSATVDGVDCYEVLLQNTGDVAEVIWWFGKQDLLPRRRQFTITDSRLNQGAVDLILANLRVDLEVEDDTFKFTLPEGYKKLNEPAPSSDRQ
jgi:outer membrane lipoprotein-sorting protein